MCIKNRLRLAIYTILQMLKVITMARDPTPKCPVDKSHTVFLDPTDNFYYCKEHIEANLGAGKYHGRIDELERGWLINMELEYKEKTREVSGRSTITNEELKTYFTRFKDKNLRIDVLKKILGPPSGSDTPLIRVNDSNKSTAVIPSSYLLRLSRHTRERWRQRRKTGEDGTPLVRFWTDGFYHPEREKDSLLERMQEAMEMEEISEKIDNLVEDLEEMLPYTDIKTSKNEQGHVSWTGTQIPEGDLPDDWARWEEYKALKDAIRHWETIIGVKKKDSILNFEPFGERPRYTEEGDLAQ